MMQEKGVASVMRRRWIGTVRCDEIKEEEIRFFHRVPEGGTTKEGLLSMARVVVVDVGIKHVVVPLSVGGCTGLSRLNCRRAVWYTA
jgi:hypothetical protein